MASLLITGGTGTIGAAVARTALAQGYGRVCIFSRDEYKQAMMREQMPDARLRWAAHITAIIPPFQARRILRDAA
jgi:UDP-glucose 4-epimerase